MSPTGSHASPDATHAAQLACVVRRAADVRALAEDSRTVCSKVSARALCGGRLAGAVETLAPGYAMDRWPVWMVSAQHRTSGAGESSVSSRVGATTVLACSVARGVWSVAADRCAVGCLSSRSMRDVQVLSTKESILSTRSSSLCASASVVAARSSILAAYPSTIARENELSPRDTSCLSGDREVSRRDREGSPGDTCGSPGKNEVFPRDREVVAGDRCLLLRHRPRSAHIREVLRASVHCCGVVVGDLRASNKSLHAGTKSFHASVDGCGEILGSFPADHADDDAKVRCCRAIARTRRTIRTDCGVAAWDRCIGRCDRRRSRRAAIAWIRRLAGTRRAAVWLAHAGPQTGQDRAQACASKHPDGYIEALF
jgi:hypothetical protein